MAKDLPEVVDHRGEPCRLCGVTHRTRFARIRGDSHSIDNCLIWQIWYRTEYADGHCDAVCACQTVVSLRSQGEAGALQVLRRLQRGHPKLHLFDVVPPPTAEQVEATRRENDLQQRIRRATGRDTNNEIRETSLAR